MRFFLYSHDGMGLGHIRRQLAIASALSSSSTNPEVLVATSIDEVPQLGLPSNVDTLKLPGLRKLGNQRYESRRLRLLPDEIRNVRASLLAAAVRSFVPDVVLVDKHPLGVGGEMREALSCAKRHGIRRVLGLRDILDDSLTVMKEWSAEELFAAIPEFFDQVLVYGIQSLFDPIEEYQFSPAIAERTHFCGYVLNTPGGGLSGASQFYPLDHAARPIVLATAGGGEDGFDLLQTFILACASAPWKGVVVTGPLLEEREFGVLQRLAVQNEVRIVRFMANLPELFWVIDGLVCMGGYNTLGEAVSTGVPIVCVPRVRPRSEQLIRAQAFEKFGLLQTLHPDYLSVESLRYRIACALRVPRHEILQQANLALNFNGTRVAARALLDLAGQRRVPLRKDTRSARLPVFQR